MGRPSARTSSARSNRSRQTVIPSVVGADLVSARSPCAKHFETVRSTSLSASPRWRTARQASHRGLSLQTRRASPARTCVGTAHGSTPQVGEGSGVGIGVSDVWRSCFPGDADRLRPRRGRPCSPILRRLPGHGPGEHVSARLCCHPGALSRPRCVRMVWARTSCALPRAAAIPVPPEEMRSFQEKCG